jgi:protein-L-isoaspartate(D-aspartate) O-methyltransferase
MPFALRHSTSTKGKRSFISELGPATAQPYSRGVAGTAGSVVGFEVEDDLVQRAKRNLADFPNVTVHCRSGSEAPLPACDAIYVNAGATAPLDVWLDALRLNGRLLFPLTPTDSDGMPGARAMLLVTRADTDLFGARFVSPAMFIPCKGARDEETAAKLSVAFKQRDLEKVRSLRRNTAPDDTCWCAGNGWWLSSAQ